MRTRLYFLLPDVATARHAISAGLLDMVGMTRAHMADPHIVRKVMEGREEDGRHMPVSLVFALANVDVERALAAISGADERDGDAAGTIAAFLAGHWDVIQETLRPVAHLYNALYVAPPRDPGDAQGL